MPSAAAGAFLNDRRLRVSGRSRLEEALLATGMPFKGKGDSAGYIGELDSVISKVAGVRRWGVASLDLAYVAAGRFDGFWERGLKPWDVAAGVLLVREAGGYVSAIDGRDFLLEGESILRRQQRAARQPVRPAVGPQEKRLAARSRASLGWFSSPCVCSSVLLVRTIGKQRCVMDILDDILETLDLKGILYFRTDFSGAWR